MLTDGRDDDPSLPEDAEHNLLSRPAFWAAYLVRMWAMDASDGRRFAEWLGTDGARADVAWELYLDDVCRLRVPFGDGHSVWVTSCEYPADWGTDYSLRHHDWERPARLASIDRYLALRLGTPEHQEGPGLAWRELTHIADTPDRTAPGIHDPHTRLLLLLPALGDAALPADAADVVGAALATAGVPSAEAVPAARFLLDRPVWPAAGWTPSPPGRRPLHRLRRQRAATTAGGILRCDAPASPRFDASVAHRLTREQRARLASALGTAPA